MRKVYESPEAEVVSFEAMEQLALLAPRGADGTTDVGGKGPSASGSVGDTVTVLVDVTGAVKICGFDFAIFYDEALELVSFDEDLDLDIIANAGRYENGMKLNFSSASDKTKQRDVIELTFKIKDTAKKSLPVTIVMESIKEIINDNPADTSYVIVDGMVCVR